MESIKTDLPRSVSDSSPSSPIQPVAIVKDAVDDFIDSRLHAKRAAIIHLQDVFNSWAPIDEYKRVKAAMDFSEEYCKEFAKIVDMEVNGSMKKKIAVDLFNSFPSDLPEHERQRHMLKTSDVCELIEILIQVSKGERKFNQVLNNPLDDIKQPALPAETQEKSSHKHRIGTWNLARKNALGKQ